MSLLNTIYHCFQINLLVQLRLTIFIWLHGRCHALSFVFHSKFKLVVMPDAPFDGTVDDIVA